MEIGAHLNCEDELRTEEDLSNELKREDDSKIRYHNL